MERIDLGAMPQSAMTLLVYGAPGTGKSTFVANMALCAEQRKLPLLIDTERGLYSAAREVGLKEAFLYSATQNGDGKEVLEALQKAMVEQNFGMVAVDTMSEFSELVLREAAGLLDTPQLQHYGTRKAVLSRCVRALRDAAGAGIPAIATFQQEAKEIEGLTGHWRPAMPEKSAVDAIAQFDCVARLRIVQDHEAERMKLEAGTRYLDFRPSSQQTAKCRTASEIFGERDPSWHVFPLRNVDDHDKLYYAMLREKQREQ